MYRSKQLLTITILILSHSALWGQDSLAKKRKDSTNLAKTSILLHKMDSMKAVDSVRRADLLNEIENLKGSEANKQRAILLKRLKEEEAEDSLKKAHMMNELTRLKSTAKGYPVAPFGDTLFYIYTKVGSFTQADRASAISGKIKKLYNDYEFSPDSLTISQGETSVEIVYKDMVIMSVNELEAMWFDKSPDSLAKEYRESMTNAIIAERKANSIQNILLRIGAIILILLGIYLLIRVVNRLFRKLNIKVYQLKDRVLKGIKFRGYQFLDSARELQLILFGIKILRLVVIAVILYITLPLVFSVFPWTRGIADTLFGWVTKPIWGVLMGVLAYLPNLFTILVIGGITHYVVKFLKFVADEVEQGVLTIPGFYADWARPTFNLVKLLLYAFSFIMIFPYLPGSDSPIFQGVSVFLGVLFSLGSSSAIANVVAGLVITYMRPFKIGDRIKVGEITGDIMEKSILVTRIRTTKNENITIPNSTMLSGHIINYTSSALESGLILHTTITIGYDVPWVQVHNLLIGAAEVTEGITMEEGKKPFVLQTSLDDFYVAYQINAYTRDSHRIATIYSALHQNIQDKFNEAGVEILSPHYRAARDGSAMALPPDYLPKNYQAPPFNVSMKNSKEDKD